MQVERATAAVEIEGFASHPYRQRSIDTNTNGQGYLRHIGSKSPKFHIRLDLGLYLLLRLYEEATLRPLPEIEPSSQ